MLTYILKRLLAMIPTLIGITVITFLIVKLAPGDPVEAKMGGGALQTTDETGGGQNERRADTIKAKKKLLGMMEEQHAVLLWDAASATSARERVAEGEYPDELDTAGSYPWLPAWPRAIAVSPDGATLYAGLKGGALFALDASSGEVTREFEPHPDTVRSLAVSPDGRTLVSVDSKGTMRLTGTADGALLAEPNPLPRASRRLRFLPDGSAFLSGCDDGVIRLHDASDGNEKDEFRGHTSYVAALALDPDGGRFWSAGYDRKLREWDLATGLAREIGEHGQAVTDMTIAPDGSFLVTACEDRIVRVWPLGTGAAGPARPIELAGHGHVVTAVALHPDGRTIFSGSRDESVRVWDRIEERQTGQVPVNIGRVDNLLLSGDGATLWSAGESWRETPILKQYWTWASKLAVGDFGRSFSDNRPVMDKIWERLPVTLGLNVLALVIIYLISIPQGVIAAVKRDSFFDHSSSFVLFLLWSLPNFWVATLLITYFSSERTMNLLPSRGLHSGSADDMPYFAWLADWGAHLVLPMVVFVYAGFTALSRYARTAVLDVISQDYIRTARAKGLSERVVVFKHALRNALIPIVTLMANLLPAMIGGSVIIEFIFNIRGMGLLAFEAILARDYPVIMAVTTFSALLTLLGILVSDLLYSVVDPRITHK